MIVTDDGTEKPLTDPKTLKSFDGLTSGKEACSQYHSGELAELELKVRIARELPNLDVRFDQTLNHDLSAPGAIESPVLLVNAHLA